MGSALRGPRWEGEALGRGAAQGDLEGRAGTRHVKGSRRTPGCGGAHPQSGSTPHLLAPIMPGPARSAQEAGERECGSWGFCPGAS